MVVHAAHSPPSVEAASVEAAPAPSFDAGASADADDAEAFEDASVPGNIYTRIQNFTRPKTEERPLLARDPRQRRETTHAKDGNKKKQNALAVGDRARVRRRRARGDGDGPEEAIFLSFFLFFHVCDSS